MGAERAIPPPPPNDDEEDAMGGGGGGGWWSGWWWLDSLVLDAMVDVGSMSMSMSMEFGVEVQLIWRKWRDESSSATKMAGRLIGDVLEPFGGKIVGEYSCGGKNLVLWRFVAKMAEH
jgi:hypothetical protein